MSEIIRYSEAKKLGLSKYFTGKPCMRGHIAPRYVAGASCMDCVIGRAANWHKTNPSKKAESQDKYRRRNLDKMAVKEARRRASKFDATPRWLTVQQLEEIDDIYRYAQEKGYHVDHIIPLKNKKVCGMHVPWNLRAIPPKENLMKRNKLVEV